MLAVSSSPTDPPGPESGDLPRTFGSYTLFEEIGLFREPLGGLEHELRRGARPH